MSSPDPEYGSLFGTPKCSSSGGTRKRVKARFVTDDYNYENGSMKDGSLHEHMYLPRWVFIIRVNTRADIIWQSDFGKDSLTNVI